MQSMNGRKQPPIASRPNGAKRVRIICGDNAGYHEENGGHRALKDQMSAVLKSIPSTCNSLLLRLVSTMHPKYKQAGKERLE